VPPVRGRHPCLAARYARPSEDVAARYVNLRTSGIPALVVLDPDSGRIKVATNQGEFANARTMSADQVEEFLKRWA
jgi:thioredoxin 1